MATPKPSKPIASACHSVTHGTDRSETITIYTPSSCPFLEHKTLIKASTPHDLDISLFIDPNKEVDKTLYSPSCMFTCT